MAATETGTHETTHAIGTKGETPPGPVAAVQPDTTGAGMVDASDWEAADTSMTESAPTLYGAVVSVEQEYQPPPAPVPGSTWDTTWTDRPTAAVVDGNYVNPVLLETETLESGTLGAVPEGSSAVPVAPAAPTASSGDRFVQVSWAAVADPADDAPVLQYVVESDSGGHVYAGADDTSVHFEHVTGGFAQKFRVRAGNRNGTGPYSPWSAAAVAPTNEDEVAVTQLAADNAVNPIYRQDGTIVPGSYGAPTAPGKPTVAAQGTAGTATVSWAASSPQPVSYEVTASSGQTASVAGSVTTADVAGLTVGAQVTFTVKAVGELQSVTSAASDPYTVV